MKNKTFMVHPVSEYLHWWMATIFIQKQAPMFQKLTNQSDMGGTLGTPVHKGLKARTEASRVVPMPDTAKDQKFTKKCQKNAMQFGIKYPNTGKTFIVQICVLISICCLFLQADTTHSQTEPTFTNPIAESGADPWVTQRDGSYFYCYSRRNRIWVSRAQHLEDIGNATPAAVWTPPENTAHSKELWAPELHYLRGKWYIYVAADDGDNFNHRMYVLEGATQNPLDPFLFKGKVTDATDRWAIDATVLQMPGDQLYFVWSGWEGNVNVQQNLYIAPMSDPLTISGPRVCISKPQLDWERNGKPLINEGPQILKNGDNVFIIYSASGSWTDDYCLGQLALVGDDPLDPNAWKKKPQPVFSRTENIFGPGHASFVKSPDGNEDWIVYHSAKHSGAGWNRKVNIQPFTWNPDGSPNFGRPVAPGVSLPVPQRD